MLSTISWVCVGKFSISPSSVVQGHLESYQQLIVSYKVLFQWESFCAFCAEEAYFFCYSVHYILFFVLR